MFTLCSVIPIWFLGAACDHASFKKIERVICRTEQKYCNQSEIICSAFYYFYGECIKNLLLVDYFASVSKHFDQTNRNLMLVETLQEFALNEMNATNDLLPKYVICCMQHLPKIYQKNDSSCKFGIYCMPKSTKRMGCT